MWLRNNVATIVSNGAENFLFYLIAFLGVFPVKDILIIAVTATLIEIVIAICDTPFLYLATKGRNNGEKADVTGAGERTARKS